MAVNFSQLVYLPIYDMFAVPVIVDPLASQPGQGAYTRRGIYGSSATDVAGMDGTIYSDQRTELYIREAEFPVRPLQGDRVTIPFDTNGEPLGEFEVIDADSNGGGETTLALRKWMTAAP